MKVTTCFRFLGVCWVVSQLQTHTVVAAPASAAVGRVPHLLQGLSAQVAQLPQAAVVENPRADPAGIEVVGRPHLADIAHLVARRLKQKRVSQVMS